MRLVGLAGLQVEQPLEIDLCVVGIGGGGGGRDRGGDDLALHQQALAPRIDQAGAELGKIENADDEREQSGEIEEDNPTGEAR